MVITVDGPVAAGKGLLSWRLAEHFGLNHLDSGMIYRATAARLLDQGDDPTDEAAAAFAAESLEISDLQRSDLRLQSVGQAASVIAALPSVRAALLRMQRRFAAKPPGAVIDGRDIGTVVCPDADVKLFVTAGLDVRAKRRFDELVGRGQSPVLAEITAEIAERDKRDMERETAPLRQAEDAILLDTSELDADQALVAALKIVEQQLKAPAKTSI
ncbi:MAG: (d)CMP kinase [Alphaproteobacteria bacterium]|nr:(d)CMP kinase [Rhodospirillaceae bacterium]MBT6511871.1 (d)CMP kinase [Rhodospirillaceae bacterium]MBT7612410.1 (d)CMP kinase [Rhodospirillaceae bacterium]MBT7646778.1 (d)CMP kinase [Rhodospirillaceae bacterium]MDG2480913.1 (d)CMP kinase [Alphaproteobacteria bacterium]